MKLSNGEIYRAYQALVELGKVKLPVRTSLDVAVITNKLEPAAKVISGEDEKLIKKYSEKDEITGQTGIKRSSSKMALYLKDLDVVLDPVCADDFNIKKIKLPEKIAGTCDSCHHNLDVTFLVEPAILMPLAEKFVEVV